MGHFRLVYQKYPLDLSVEEPRITLRASSGSWPGQELGDYVVLDLEVKSPKFFFDPNNGPEDDVSQWLNPGLDTQWLKIPLKHFKNRDFRSLEEILIDFRGEGTPNALTREDWWEAYNVHPFFREWKSEEYTYQKQLDRIAEQDRIINSITRDMQVNPAKYGFPDSGYALQRSVEMTEKFYSGARSPDSNPFMPWVPMDKQHIFYEGR